MIDILFRLALALGALIALVSTVLFVLWILITRRNPTRKIADLPQPLFDYFTEWKTNRERRRIYRARRKREKAVLDQIRKGEL